MKHPLPNQSKVLAFFSCSLLIGIVGCSTENNPKGTVEVGNNRPATVNSEASNQIKPASKERILDWVIPENDNFKYFINHLPAEGMQLAESYCIFTNAPNLQKNEIGIVRASEVNGTSGAVSLFLTQVQDNEMLLEKTKVVGGTSSEADFYCDDKSTFIKLPNGENATWQYVIRSEKIKCKSHFIGDTILAVERKTYDANSNELYAFEIEYYKKKEGLTKITQMSVETNKKMFEYVFAKSEKLSAQNFPLTK